MLGEAVLAVADGLDELVKEMKEEAKSTGSGGAVSLAVAAAKAAGFARELRTAVKASGGDRPAPRQTPGGLLIPGAVREENLDPAVKEALERDREARQRRSALEERSTERQVELVGGPAAEGGMTMAPINPEMPVGGFSRVGDAVYQLRKDGKLHYSNEETLQLKERLAKGQKG